MKKLVSLLLCLSLLTLAGCARAEQAKSGGSPLPSETRNETPGGHSPQNQPGGGSPHGSGGAWAMDEVTLHPLY